MWEKTIRCTVCTWRGPMDVAESKPRMKAAELDPATDAIQHMYDEREGETEAIGGHRLPPCPMCGHHTLPVRLHGYHAVG
jgi:hypothetical protein